MTRETCGARRTFKTIDHRDHGTGRVQDSRSAESSRPIFANRHRRDYSDRCYAAPRPKQVFRVFGIVPDALTLEIIENPADFATAGGDAAGSYKTTALPIELG